MSEQARSFNPVSEQEQAEKRIAEYLDKAADARRSARTAMDARAHDSFKKIAEGWQELADQLSETIERRS